MTAIRRPLRLARAGALAAACLLTSSVAVAAPTLELDKKAVQQLRPLQAPAQEPEPWTTTDIIDARIDVSAQYSLMRMFGGNVFEQFTASQILSAVKDGRIGGIYIANQQVPALRARAAGGNYWTMIPQGLSSVCYDQPAGKPPIIVMREGIAKTPAVVDDAIADAFWFCNVGEVEPRGYAANLPPKQPRTKQGCEDAKGTGDIVVTVRRGGKAVAGHTVTLTGVVDRTGTSNASGLVTFAALPAGGYVVSFSDGAGGYEMISREVRGTCHVTVAADLAHAGKTAPAACDPSKYAKEFDKCGLPLFGAAVKCVANVHAKYWTAGGGDKGARGALSALLGCYKLPSQVQGEVDACRKKANAASGCSY